MAFTIEFARDYEDDHTETGPIEISEDEFASRFLPQANEITWNDMYDYGEGGCLFETFGEDLAFVREIDPAFVWTIKEDDDNNLILQSGFYILNREGYLVCARPVQDGEDYLCTLEE